MTYVIKRTSQPWWLGPHHKIVYTEKEALRFPTYSGKEGALIVQQSLGSGWTVEEASDG